MNYPTRTRTTWGLAYRSDRLGTHWTLLDLLPTNPYFVMLSGYPGHQCLGTETHFAKTQTKQAEVTTKELGFLDASADFFLALP